jgi:hypothetical protein
MIPILDLNLILTLTTFFIALEKGEVNLKSDPQKLIETNIRKCDLVCVRLAASLTILWIQLLLSVRSFAGILMAELRPHSGFKWPKHTGNKFTWCDFTNFWSNFQPINWISVSGYLIALHLQNLTNCSVNFTNFQI